MSTRTLRWLGVILPVLFWGVIIALRTYLAPHITVVDEAAIEIAMVVLFGAIFSNWVADRFEEHQAEIQVRAEQLEALRQAALALTTEVALDDLLQRIVEISRELVGARYAALGVLDAAGNQIDQLLTAGLSAEQRAHMGDLPHGRGLLGAILTERRALRVDSIASDPRASGFPPHHPAMTTLLGVPLISKGVVFGNLYLTDKVNPTGGPPLPFSEQDQTTVEMFAAQAAVAIDNARLHQQNQQLAIMQERERFGMNLHDGVIQSIYAIGLILDDVQHRVDEDPELTRQRIGQTIAGLNEVIRDIRSYIMDLRPQKFEGRTLQQGLEELVAYVTSSSQLNVRLRVDAAAAASATPGETAELLHIAQEALTNIQKHAFANLVEIRLSRIGSRLFLTIEDNGRGFDVFRTASKAPGNGLRNMQQRARVLDGEFEIESTTGKGTRIVLSVPVSR